MNESNKIISERLNTQLDLLHKYGGVYPNVKKKKKKKKKTKDEEEYIILCV